MKKHLFGLVKHIAQYQYHSQYYRRNRLVFIVIKKWKKGKSGRLLKSEYASL